jgi:hypothetical protein
VRDDLTVHANLPWELCNHLSFSVEDKLQNLALVVFITRILFINVGVAEVITILLKKQH